MVIPRMATLQMGVTLQKDIQPMVTTLKGIPLMAIPLKGIPQRRRLSEERDINAGKPSGRRNGLEPQWKSLLRTYAWPQPAWQTRSWRCFICVHCSLLITVILFNFSISLYDFCLVCECAVIKSMSWFDKGYQTDNENSKAKKNLETAAQQVVTATSLLTLDILDGGTIRLKVNVPNSPVSMLLPLLSIFNFIVSTLRNKKANQPVKMNHFWKCFLVFCLRPSYAYLY